MPHLALATLKEFYVSCGTQLYAQSGEKLRIIRTVLIERYSPAYPKGIILRQENPHPKDRLHLLCTWPDVPE